MLKSKCQGITYLAREWTGRGMDGEWTGRIQCKSGKNSSWYMWESVIKVYCKERCLERCWKERIGNGKKDAEKKQIY